MKKLISFVLALTVIFALFGCAGTENGTESEEAKEPTSVKMTLTQDGGELGSNEGENGAALSGGFTLQPGATVTVDVTGTKYLKINFFNLGDAIVYVPDGKFVFTVPSDNDQRVYPENTFKNSFVLTASVPTRDELKASRTVSLNPYDTKDGTAFPHATANNEYSNGSDPDFRARNAIDGFTQNTAHGRYPYQSWGPDRIDGLEFKIDLGRECVVTGVTLFIRADFPHDTNWGSCDIVDSNGNTIMTATIAHTADGQTFTFDSPVTTSSITFKNMTTTDNHNAWVGFTEVSITGYDK